MNIDEFKLDQFKINKDQLIKKKTTGVRNTTKSSHHIPIKSTLIEKKIKSNVPPISWLINIQDTKFSLINPPCKNENSDLFAIPVKKRIKAISPKKKSKKGFFLKNKIKIHSKANKKKNDSIPIKSLKLNKINSIKQIQRKSIQYNKNPQQRENSVVDMKGSNIIKKITSVSRRLKRMNRSVSIGGQERKDFLQNFFDLAVSATPKGVGQEKVSIPKKKKKQTEDSSSDEEFNVFESHNSTNQTFQIDSKPQITSDIRSSFVKPRKFDFEDSENLNIDQNENDLKSTKTENIFSEPISIFGLCHCPGKNYSKIQTIKNKSKINIKIMELPRKKK